MSEYLIKTTVHNRDRVEKELTPYRVVTDRWSDGSFNFQPYDSECEDEMVERCEAPEDQGGLNVEATLV